MLLETCCIVSVVGVTDAVDEENMEDINCGETVVVDWRVEETGCEGSSYEEGRYMLLGVLSVKIKTGFK